MHSNINPVDRRDMSTTCPAHLFDVFQNNLDDLPPVLRTPVKQYIDAAKQLGDFDVTRSNMFNMLPNLGCSDIDADGITAWWLRGQIKEAAELERKIFSGLRLIIGD